MVAPAANVPAVRSPIDVLSRSPGSALPAGVAVVMFAVLFASPARGLVRDWFNDPDAGQGLLLFPVSLWLAWRAGIVRDAAPDRTWGTVLLLAAMVLRALSALAAEFFTQRFSIWLAVLGVVVFCWGWRQVRHWWLPFTLLALAIPMPALIINRLTLPLQFEASKLGTELIRWRHIPVRADGNVITIPGQQLFVAEACSGLRSMSALIAMGVMISAMYLATLPARVLLILLAIPVAVLVNGFRIFLTAFLIHFVDPALGQGFMHLTEGWALFVAALGILAAIAWLIRAGERLARRRLGGSHA